VDMALGVALLLYRERHEGRWVTRRLTAAVAGGVLATALVGWGVSLDRRVLTSGVYRYAQVRRESDDPVLYYRDGRTASVGAFVEEPRGMVVLSTNGKPDASLTMRWIVGASRAVPRQPLAEGDESTQALAALISLAHAPGGRTAVVIGQGSGLTGHLLLASPALERLTTVEIEPEMIRGSEVFYPANARVFDDPRSRFVIDDAKSFFAAHPARYDIIVSEPSNPWVSGDASLFTVEFYRRVRGYLTEGGIFAQWFHLYDMTDSLATSVLAALHRAFPDFRGYLVGPGDILVVATRDTLLAPPDWSVLDTPALQRDLASVSRFRPEILEDLAIFDRRLLAPLLSEWSFVNSDFRPVLDAGAEKAFFRGDVAVGLASLADDPLDLARALAGRCDPAPGQAEEPFLGLPPLWRGSLAAWLRTGAEGEPPPGNGIQGSAGFRESREAYVSLASVLAGDGPPWDWATLMSEVSRTALDLHGRFPAVPDRAFFDALHGFLARTDPPPEALAAADFLSGLAELDLPRVSRATDLLVEPVARGEPWVPAPLLVEGGVVSKLQEGDADGARRVYEALAGSGREVLPGLRGWLLQAFVREGRLPGVVRPCSIPGSRPGATTDSTEREVP